MRSPRQRERGKNGGDDELTVAWNNDDAKTQGKNKGSQMQLHLSGRDGERNHPGTCKQQYAVKEKMELFYAHGGCLFGRWADSWL